MFPDILQHIDPSTYFSDNYIVLDFETAHFERGFPDPVVAPWAKLHLAVYKTGDVYYYNWKDEYHQRILVELCESVDFVVAHNSKFELGWLKRCGIDLTRAVVWDTMIAENVIAGNRKWDLTLEGTCSRWGLPGKVKGVSKMLGAGICPSDIPDHLLLEYCKTDVKVTEQVFLKQLEYMKTTKLLPEVFIECLAVPVLTDMEFQGLPLRKQETINVYTEAVYKKNELDLKLNKITGGINLNSPKQRSEFLFNEMKFPLPKDYKGNVKKTATGQVSTGKDTIEKLKCKTKKQKDFIELYKERNKITAAIDKPLKGCYNCVMESNDPLLYGSFNQTVAGTHRLTSTGKSHKIQLQNFPNAYKYLVGKEGHKILNVDYSKVEFAVAAFLANDEVARKDFINDFDIHKFSAAVMKVADENKDMDIKEIMDKAETIMNSIDKESRRLAKPHTFKPIYRGRSGTKAQQAYYKAFREKYRGIDSAQEEWIDFVLKHKYLELPTGMLFYWPGCRMKSSGYIEYNQQIGNYPVQYFATARISLIGMICAWHNMKKKGYYSRIIAAVHDNIVSCVDPRDDEKDLKKTIEISLTSNVYDVLLKLYGIKYDLPLKIDVEIGNFWR